jgi:pimeloyl-ACP methyl ester carboxylesterase
LDLYVGEFTRTGIEPANNWYAAFDKGWENTSLIDEAFVQQPALYLSGEHTRPPRQCWGSTGKRRPLESLKTTFRDVRDIIIVPGVGHTPPEERPDEINAYVPKFLKDIGY